MRWLKNGGVLLALSVAAVLVAWLGSRPADQEAPTGSVASYAPDGSRALLLWIESRPETRAHALERLEFEPGATPDTVFVIQPLWPITPAEEAALDEVLRAGGTLVLAGDSPALRTYLERFDVMLDFARVAEMAHPPADDELIPFSVRNRLTADDATPLLVTLHGDVVALHKPYLGGTVLVLATPSPLTNAGLRHPATARFVYREIVQPLPPTASVAFDQSHYAEPAALGAAEVEEGGLGRLLLGTPLGRALLYAAGLTFLFLLLTGRRLGPPLPAVQAGDRARTMYEQVQALAGLYRASRQFPYARAHFAQRYRRQVARSLGIETVRLGGPDVAAELRSHGVTAERADALAAALRQLDQARTEAQLRAAVSRMERQLAELPRGRGATLSAA